MALYQRLEIYRVGPKDVVVEADVDETAFVYIVLRGAVDEVIFKFETQQRYNVATYRTGEIFGDASIQKRLADPLKCLNRDKQYLETAAEDCWFLRIPKNEYVKSLFSEMPADLMFKILLFWQTPHFKSLSPYSLIMFASICDVKEYKCGEIVFAQNEVPEESYLLLHGSADSVY